MDFVHDQLFDGRRFRILTVVDHWSRESVLVEPQFGFSGQAVAEALERWVSQHGAPVSISIAVNPQTISIRISGENAEDHRIAPAFASR